MGVAEVIPGVSGGTVAFLTGIYNELIASIKSVDLEALKLILRLRFREFWKKINGKFLLSVFAGFATSIISLAKLIVYLLSTYPILVWSFFFGLVIIAAPLVFREIKHWTIAVIIAPFIGIIIAYAITNLSPTHLPNSPIFIFLSGAMAICAVILPGISGAFILLLIGKYQFVITSLVEVDMRVMSIFVLGCVFGIVLFARILSWILAKYHDITIALLAGFMLGSLNKIWPWREILEYVTNSKGVQIPAFDKSVLPWQYFEKTGKDPLILQAIFMMALGVIIVVLIDKVVARLKTKN